MEIIDIREGISFIFLGIFVPSTPSSDAITGTTLLQPSDPLPYAVYPGTNLDWLIVCDHASNRFPGALGDMGLPAGAERLHIAWDIGAASVAQRLAERLSAPLICCNYSRLVIDCNRYPSAEEAIPASSDGIMVPANVELTAQARQARIKEIFEPYQRTIATRLDEAFAAGRTPVLLSVHSCNPTMYGVERQWDIGLGWQRDHRTARPLLAALNGVPGLVVGDNEPYALDLGHDFTTPEHAMARGLAHVQVEFRNDLVADEAGARRYADLFADALLACASDPAWHRQEHYLTAEDSAGPAQFNGRG